MPTDAIPQSSRSIPPDAPLNTGGTRVEGSSFCNPAKVATTADASSFCKPTQPVPATPTNTSGSSFCKPAKAATTADASSFCNPTQSVPATPANRAVSSSCNPPAPTSRNALRPWKAWRISACLAASLVCASAQQPPGRTNPFDTPDGRDQGAALFQTHCAYCHGARGEGGRGADLTTGNYRHGGSDQELYATVRLGIPGTDMPAVRVSDDDVWKMTAFVRTLGAAGLRETATGDPRAGKVVYDGKGGCAACHAIKDQSGKGEGGSVGPDLTGIGRSRGLNYLMESLVTPDADVAVPYRAIGVITKAGKTARGIRLNEDDISIQLRDSGDNLLSFFKDDLKEIRRDKPSLMPAYGKALSRKELEDVVAYLSSLRGVQ
jgi:putative heme-binding domain-containing protein